MITGALLEVFGAIITLIASALPTTTFLPASITIPSFVTSGSGVMGFLNTYLPVSEMLTCLRYMITYYFPAVIAYKLANWVYRHIPAIGGGG